MQAKFGPAGGSDRFSAECKSSLQLPGWVSRMGLDHFEYQCGRGVRVSDKLAASLRAKAEEHGVTVSLHAPYFISLSSTESEKRDKSIDYILQSADAAKRATAFIIGAGPQVDIRSNFSCCRMLWLVTNPSSPSVPSSVVMNTRP